MTYESRFGPGAIVTASGRIRRHLWGKPLAELSLAAKRLEPAAVETGIPVDLESALQDYFNGVPTELARWPFEAEGFSAFFAGAYKAVRSLKWGKTATYSEIAAAIGNPGAARAVGAALACNPAPLFIPCHRVVARGGEGGWTGPPGLKAKLLALEGVRVRGSEE